MIRPAPFFWVYIVLVLVVLGRSERQFEYEDDNEDDYDGSGWVLVDLAPLQTECGALIRSQVGSIPTRSRHPYCRMMTEKGEWFNWENPS